jgi:hypothetical protein
MRLLRHAPLLILALLVGLVAGCGSSDRKPVFAAEGRIVFDGKPIPHALVTLHPLNPSDRESPRPHGSVTKDGTFVLTTYDAGDGAPAGEYGVTVEWWLTNATARTGEGDSPPPTNRLPGRYARVETSKLRVRIEEGANQLPIIQLSR